jgi:hypothetical protein
VIPFIYLNTMDAEQLERDNIADKCSQSFQTMTYHSSPIRFINSAAEVEYIWQAI